MVWLPLLVELEALFESIEVARIGGGGVVFEILDRFAEVANGTCGVCRLCFIE